MKNDVTIVGGGFVGCLAALMLAKLNLNITIIEAKPLNTQQTNDPRGIALNYASCELLKRLGLWSELISHAMPVKMVHVSAKNTFSKVRFYAEDQRLDYLAQVIEGTHLLNTLIEHTKSDENISWQQPETIEKIEADKEQITTALQSGSRITARLLIAADGQRSSCRKLLGIDAKSKMTQHALLTNITLNQSHEHIAYERFTQDGTIALLPLTQMQCKLVITGDEQQIKNWESLSEKYFLEKVQISFGHFAGNFTAASQRIHYPLTELSVNQQTTSRAVLLGNAAHALHPIAAQGLNLAIQDLMNLTGLIKTAVNARLDIASDKLLLTYQEKVKRKQWVLTQLTNTLSKLHGGIINRSALALVANCPAIKALIQEQALGV